jgi:hypothetical protein
MLSFSLRSAGTLFNFGEYTWPPTGSFLSTVKMFLKKKIHLQLTRECFIGLVSGRGASLEPWSIFVVHTENSTHCLIDHSRTAKIRSLPRASAIEGTQKHCYCNKLSATFDPKWCAARQLVERRQNQTIGSTYVQTKAQHTHIRWRQQFSHDSILYWKMRSIPVSCCIQL